MHPAYVARPLCRLFPLSARFCLLLLCLLAAGALRAQSGTADGVYDYRDVGAAGSAGTGMKSLNDKFAVSDAFVADAGGTPSLGAGNVLYMANPGPGSLLTGTIRAAGGAVCATFSLRDMSFSNYSGGEFESISVTLYGYWGNTIAQHSFMMPNYMLAAGARTSLSAMPFSTPWPASGYDGVSRIELSWRYGHMGVAGNLVFWDMTIANVSNSVPAGTAVGALSASSFCPGAPITVPYTAGGFSTGNVFTAQLSDASGSFAAPVTLGSVTSTASGVLTGLIPAGTTPGGGYRIRIVGSNPSFTPDTDNGSNLTVYAPPAAPFLSAGHVSCFGGTNGSLQANMGPAGMPGGEIYTYLWSNGATGAGISGLSAGTYSVTVTDGRGCTASGSSSITQPAAALTATAVATGVSCYGGSNGAIDVSVSGGTAPYTVVWQDAAGGPAMPGMIAEDRSNLAAGTYSATITDANGCNTALSVTVGQPAAVLSVSALATPVTCFGDTDGAVDLTVTGGTAPYSYSWSDSVATEDRSGLPAGLYSVTVTDAQGCTAGAMAPVASPVLPVVDSIPSRELCAGTWVPTAFFTGNAATYQWTNSNPATGFAASGADSIAAFTAVNTDTVARISTVTVIPVTNGCAGAARTFTISVHPAPSVDPIADQSLCAGAASAAVTFSSPVAGTSFLWSNNNTGIGLAAGNGMGHLPSFTALNATDTTQTATLTVIASTARCLGSTRTFSYRVHPVPVVDSVANVPLCAGSNSNIVVFSGPVPNTTYSWTNNNTSIGLAASGAGHIASFVPVNSGTAPVSATVTVTPATSFCTGAARSFAFIVNPKPAAFFSYPAVAYCAADSTAPTLTGTAGGVFTATAGCIVNPFTGVVDLATSTQGMHTITYNSVALFPCTPATATAIIFVRSVPQVTGTSDLVACNGQAFVAPAFTGTDSSTATYTWSNSNPAIGLPAGGTGNLPMFTPVAPTAPQTATITVIASKRTTTGGATPEVLFYNFEGSGKTVVNEASAPPSGTASTSIIGSMRQATPGICGKALTGAGGSSLTNYFNTGWAPSLPSTGWTVSFKTSNIPQVRDTTYYVFGDVNVGGFRCLTGSASGKGAWILRGGFTDVVATGGAASGTRTTTFVYDATARVIKAYVDGVLVNTVAQSSVTVSGARLKIGGYSNSLSLPKGALVDNFRVYSRSLSAAEVLALNDCVSDLTCTGTPKTITLTVNPVPNVAAVANLVYCNGATTDSIPFAGTIDGATYTWTNSNPGIGLAAAGTGTLPSFTAINDTTEARSATITVTPYFGNCSGAPVTFTITVNPSQAATLSYPSAGFCASGSAVATLTGNTGGSFSADAGLALDAQTGNIDLGASAPGSYTVTYTGPTVTGCTPASASAVVTVLAIPTAQADSFTLCADVPATLPAFTGTGTSYNWINNDPSIGLPASGTGDLPVFTPLNAGNSPVSAAITVTPVSGYLVGADSLYCVGTPVDIVLTIKPAAVPTSISYDAAPYCPSGTATPQFAGVAGGFYTGEAGLMIDAATGIVDLAASAPGTYTVTYTPPSDWSCTAADTALIVILPTLVADAIADTTVCAGTSVQLPAFAGTGSSYTWTNTDMSIGLADAGTGDLPAFTATNSGTSPATAIVTVTPQGNGCPVTPVTFSITVNPVFSAAITYGDANFCQTGTATPTMTGTPGGTWSAPAGVAIDALSGLVNLAASTPGIYTVSYTVPAFAPCAAMVATATIVIAKLPEVTQPADIVVCTGTSVAPAAFSATQGATLSWTNATPAIGLAASGTGNLPSFTATNSGTAPLTATITVTAATTATTVPVPDILYYTFEGSGTSVPNLASAPPAGTATATISGPTQGVAGTCGNALQSVGGGSSGSNMVSTGWNINLPGTGWTISFLTANISNLSTIGYVFGDADITRFRCFANGAAGNGNFILRGNDIADVLVTGAVSGTHVITFVADPSVGKIKAYVDGVLVNSVSQSNIAIGGGAFTINNFGTSNTLPAGSLLDNFRVYGRVLSDAEVSALNYCPETPSCTGTSVARTFTITVNPVQDATVSYGADILCPSGTATPTITGVSGGTFSAPAGVSINPATGVLDLGASTPGTYTISYTVPALAPCTSKVVTTSVVIGQAAVLNQPADVVACGGSTVAPAAFSSNSSSSVTYTWTNSNPVIGLAASGSGNLPSFTAANSGTSPVTATITVTPTSVAANPPVPDVLLYTFEGSGTSVPNGATAPPSGTTNATIVGSHTQGVAGVCGNALQIAGTSSGNYLNTGWATSLPSTGWTVSFQTVNFPSFDLSDVGAYYLFGDNTGSGMRCFANGAANPGNETGNLLLRISGFSDIKVPGGGATGSHVVTFVADPAAGNVKAYVDGTLVNTVSQSNFSVSGSGPFRVGGYSGQNGLPAGTLLDNFRVYKRALSAAEVASLNYCPGALTCAGTGTPKTFTITVKPKAGVNAVASAVYCTGSAVAATPLTAPAAGTTFTWTNSNPAIGLAASGTGDIPAFTATNSGSSAISATISVTPSLGDCVGTPYQFTRFVEPALSVPVVSDVTLCAGSSSPAISLGSNAFTTYAWTNPNPAIGLAATGLGTIPAFTATNTTFAPMSAGVTVAARYTGFQYTTYTTHAGTGSTSQYGIAPNNAADFDALFNSGNSHTTVYATGTANPSSLLNFGSRSVLDAAGVQMPSSGDYFGLEIVGTFTPVETGTYRFGITGDDAVELSLDGTVLIAYYGAHGAGHYEEANINLVAGTPYRMRVRMQDYAGGEALRVDWKRPSLNYYFPHADEMYSSCATPDTFHITVNPLPKATFSYEPLPLCASGTVAPLFEGSTGGTFTAPAGVVIDPSTGVVNLSASTPGSYTVTYTTNAADACTPQAVAEAALIINALPAIATPASISTCNGVLLTPGAFTGTGLDYTWTNSNPAIGLDASGYGDLPAVTAVNTGTSDATATITVTAMSQETGCESAPVTFTITVRPTPAATITYAASPYYIGAGTASVTQSGTTGGVYSSTPGLVIDAATGSIDLAASTAGSYTVTYTVPATSSCAAFSTTTTVQLIEFAAVITYTGSPYCGSTGTATVTRTGASGGTYSALPAGLVINAATGAIDLALSAAGTYTVRYSYGSTFTEATVSIRPTTYINAQSNEVFCAGSQTAPLTFSGAHGFTFGWTASDPSIGLPASGTGGINAFTAVNTGTSTVQSTITVTAYGGTGCATKRMAFRYSVKPVPVLTAIANQALCAGSPSAAVTFTSSLSTASYAWTNSNTATGLAASGTGNIASFTAANSTGSTQVSAVTVTPTASGCAGTPASFSISVSPAAGSIAYPSATYCQTGTATPVLSGGTGGIFSASPAGLVIDAATGVINLATSATGTYTVSYEVTGAAACGGAATTTVSVRSALSSIGNMVLCNGVTTAAIPLNGVSGSYSWTLTGSAVGLAAGTGTTIPSFTATNSGNAPIYAMVSVSPIGGGTGGCTDKVTTFRITVNPTPTVNTIASQTGLCPGMMTNAVTFSGNMTSGVTYNWTNTETRIGLAGRGTTHIASFSALNPTSGTLTANVTVTPIANKCTGIAKTFSISVGSCVTRTSGTPGAVKRATEEEPVLSDEVIVGPNPTQGRLQIRYRGRGAGPFTVQLTSALGQVILRPATFTGTTYSMDLTGLTSGVYLLQFTAPGMKRAMVSRIVKL
ncbi:LamG-like jellyroll fold domain-containing protein [Flaviaesturariibacter amylovorans]|uniref:PA14 domain-containing protein n=1 Tax=Flaviaesturariibacter amylovorans TaxID=1084520 RepID=A0ABP8H7N2_9BACT